MQLEDDSPWGLKQPGLHIAFEQDSSLHQQGQTVLARYFGPNPTESPWRLNLTLNSRQELQQFPQIMGWATPSSRVRMQIVASGVLSHHKTQTPYKWTVQGDTAPGQEAVLKGLLLERLASKMYEDLGPRYVYR